MWYTSVNLSLRENDDRQVRDWSPIWATQQDPVSKQQAKVSEWMDELIIQLINQSIKIKFKRNQ